MPRPSATRGGRRLEHQKATPPSRLVAHPDIPITPGSGLGNGSILAEIKEHLATGKPVSNSETERIATGASSNGQDSGHLALSLSSDCISPSTGLASSSSTSNSAQSSNTLVTNPFDDVDPLPALTQKEGPDFAPDDGLCEIIDLRTGHCRGGENCRLLHLVDDEEVNEIVEPQVDGRQPFLSNSNVLVRMGNNVMNPSDVGRQGEPITFDLQLSPNGALEKVRKSQRQTMQPTILDDLSRPSEHPKVIAKLPPSTTPNRRELPPNYCRNWQKGRCARYRCKFLHANFPEGSQPESSGETGGSKLPGPPINTKLEVLNVRVPGICWNWQRGTCRNGSRCRFKHAMPIQDGSSKVASPSSSKQNDLMSGVTPACLPMKEGCTFCLLGLCIGTHRTAASFVLSNSNAPKAIGLKELAASVQKDVKPAPNLSIPGSRTRPLAANATTGQEELTLTLLKSTRATFGRGLQVLNVSTAFESNTVALGNLPAVIFESDLRSIGEDFGEVVSVEHKQVQSGGLRSSAKLVYSNHSEAAAAVAALNGSMHFFDKVTAHLYHNTQATEIGRLRACLVRVDIPAPGIVAYAGYETKQQAEQVVNVMNRSTFKKHVIAAHLHCGLPKVGPFTVKFEGLPHQTTEKHIRTFEKGRRKAPAGDILLQKGAYKSLTDVTYVLQNIFEEYDDVISFDVSRSVPCNGRIRGIARFASAVGAAAACAALNGRRFAFLGSEKIYLQHLHKMVYKIPFLIHRALLPELERLAGFARGQPGVQLTFNDAASRDVEIDLSASHLDSLKRVKTPLERLIAGETLAERGKHVWDNFFSTASGNLFVGSVSRRTGTHIRLDNMRCSVRLWGSVAAVVEARVLLLNELKRLQATNSYVVPLTGKVLVQVFNSLDDICKEIGKDNAFVDFTAGRLVVRGTEEQFRWVIESLSKQTGSISTKGQSMGSKNVANEDGGDESCPICLDGVSDGVGLDCGHNACKDCLVRYLASACDHKMFPLKCLGSNNQCMELLPLPLCQRLLPKEQFARLVEASFFTHIQTRPQEFHYCPTPDCPQIYRDAPAVILQCPTCLVRICPSCHEVQHDGIECRVTSEAGERLFNEWREQHNVKTCPRCSANIEKIAGCNHVTCVSCNTHICWECLETFGASNEVYDHMVRAHGGIGL